MILLVTGGTGYIAGEVIAQALDAGWQVRATVRIAKRIAPLAARLGDRLDQVALYEADLTHDAGWAEAMAGCTHVAHVASPLPIATPRDPNVLIGPARDGMLRALRFAAAAGVQRLVQTSSVAAIVYGHSRTREHFTAADWTNPEAPGVTPYAQSKTHAERAARDWLAAHPGVIEFVSINPALVWGPVASGDFSASLEVLRRLLAGLVPGCPDIGFGVVDTRDVAALHLRALTEPGLDGERLIASTGFYTVAGIARILRAELGHHARRVPTRALPDWVLHLAGVFSPAVRHITGELGRRGLADASHTRERLGFTFRPVEATIRDAALSLIERGVVRG